MLSIERLNVAIQSVQVLRQVSLELPTGTMAGLIGRNGAGKTTLMRSIMGLLKIASGTVNFNGVDLIAAPTYARRAWASATCPRIAGLFPI